LTEQHKGAICRALVSKVDKTKIISIKRDKVYLNYGESAGAKVGQRFEVYAKGNALEDPDTGVKLGIEEEKVGVVEVIDVQVEYSIAKVVEGTLSEMHEGNICSILVFDKNDKMQEPSGEAGKALEISQLKIITAKEKKAYLNQGKSKGIKAGQTYAVYVQGEALKDPDTGIKLGIEEEEVGIIKVIDVRDEYSIATIVEGLITEQHRGAICRIVKFEAKGNVGNMKLPESLGQSENVAKKIEIKKPKNNQRKKNSSPELREERKERERIEFETNRKELVQNSNGTLRDKSAQQVKKLVDRWKEGLGRWKWKEISKFFSVETFYKVFGEPDKKQFLSSQFEPDSYYFLYNCKDGVVQIKVHAEQLDDNGIVLIQDLNIF
jgi:hypothetical protein